MATTESIFNPFLNPAHGTIYSGATIMAVSILLLAMGRLGLPVSLSLRTKYIMRAGIDTLLSGGLYDFWWHTTFEFADSTPWTLSHMTTTAGFLVLFDHGVVALSKNSSTVVKGAFALSLILFIALWGTVILLTY